MNALQLQILSLGYVGYETNQAELLLSASVKAVDCFGTILK